MDRCDKGLKVCFSFFLTKYLVYGLGMCYPLPHADIRFATNAELDWLGGQLRRPDFGAGDGLAADAPVGWYVEASLIFPDNVKDLLREYPPLTKHKCVPASSYSAHQIEMLTFLKEAPSKTAKLIADLEDVDHYKLHYSTLILVLSLGVILKKIHRAAR